MCSHAVLWKKKSILRGRDCAIRYVCMLVTKQVMLCRIASNETRIWQRELSGGDGDARGTKGLFQI